MAIAGTDLSTRDRRELARQIARAAALHIWGLEETQPMWGAAEAAEAIALDEQLDACAAILAVARTLPDLPSVADVTELVELANVAFVP